MSPEMKIAQDKMHEECGVFGAYGVGNEAASLTYLGLYALQHRGQESAGIATSDGASIQLSKGMGLVPDVFDDETVAELTGSAAIGHVRYSTAGGSSLANAQPLLVHCARGSLAMAHNGNLVNAEEIKRELIAQGALFQSTTDSEVIANLIARSQETELEEAIIDACSRIRGAFSLVLLAQDKVIGLRDPHGFRPLCLGKYKEGFIIASESCAIHSIGGQFIRDVAPGEMIVISKDGVQNRQVWRDRPARCVFEYIYFARPDSTIDGRNVHEVRQALGKALARETGVEADLVIGVPDSGTSSALGYSKEAGIPYGEGMIKNRYVGRTFIQPQQKTREKSVRIKLNPIIPSLQGKRVIMVDDSIVRGTTSGQIVKMLKDSGAKEVHVRVSSPPVMSSCYFGMDTPEREHLVAANYSIEEIRQSIGADTLGYISMQGLLEAVGLAENELCLSCFTGEYIMDTPCGKKGGCSGCDGKL